MDTQEIVYWMNDGFGPLEPAASIAKTELILPGRPYGFTERAPFPLVCPLTLGMGVGGQQLDVHCGTHVCNVTVSEDFVAKINLKLPKEK